MKTRLVRSHTTFSLDHGPRALSGHSAGVVALLLLSAACGASGADESTSHSSARIGTDPVGTLTDDSGLCVDVPGGVSDNGTPMQVWGCNGNAWQSFTFTSGAFVASNGKCIDVQAARNANGTPVQLYDCNGTVAQQWSVQGSTLVGAFGKCLTATAGAQNGGRLEIDDCDGSARQRFTFNGTTGTTCGGGDAGPPTPPPPGPDAGPPPPPPPPPPPGDDLGAARAFMQPLTVGFNVERGWAWSIPGGVPANAQYLKSLGVTHVRLFYPWSPSANYGVDPGNPNSQMQAFLDAAGQWIAGGLTVFVDCTDLMGVDDFNNSKNAIYQEVTDMAQMAAAHHFPTDKFAMGPINEWVGDDGNGGDPFGQYRNDLHAIIRSALPGYVLTVSSEYWDYYGRLLHLTPMSDKRVVYAFHAYESHANSSEWQNAVVKPITDWSTKNGRLPVFMGEAGPWSEDWVSWSNSTMPALSVFRPAFWAITYGSALRLNKSGSDASLNADAESFIIGAAKAAQAALVGNDGAP